jgi:transposase
MGHMCQMKTAVKLVAINAARSWDRAEVNMPFRLPENKRLQILAPKHDFGLTRAQITRRVRCKYKTVTHWMEVFAKTGGVRDAPRPGRPRATTPMEDRQLFRASRRDPTLRSARLTVTWNNKAELHVSPRTTCNQLVEMGIASALSHYQGSTDRDTPTETP